MYAVGTFSNVADTFGPLVERLAQFRAQLLRVIIILLQAFSRLLRYRDLLGSSLLSHAPGAPDITRFQLVDMFTCVTDSDIKEGGFSAKSCQLGIDCGGVREVVRARGCPR